VLGVLNPVMKVVLNGWLVPVWGVAGVALAFLGMTVVTTAALLSWLSVRAGALVDRGFWVSSASLVLATGSMLAVMTAVGVVPAMHVTAGFIVACALGVTAYLATCWVMRCSALYDVTAIAVRSARDVRMRMSGSQLDADR
jgi:O-antigen/teichoic acid export membrane protein